MHPECMRKQWVLFQRAWNEVRLAYISSFFIIGENDLAEVLRFVLDILERWEDLGMALDIKIPELKVIETDKSNSRERMKAMLLVWLRGRGGDSNWKTLCEALRDKLVQRDDVAKKIELAIQKHTCT